MNNTRPLPPEDRPLLPPRLPLTVACLAALACAACGPPAGRVMGASTDLFGGPVTSWATLESDQAVREVGFTLPMSVIRAAPTDKRVPFTNIILEFPAAMKGRTFVNHLQMDYSAAGHPPAGLFDVPHFDIHFYTIDQAGVRVIDCLDNTMPEAARFPPGYVMSPPGGDPLCTPGMGYHAVNTAAPEFSRENPQKFTASLLVGYYKGAQLFLEPMVTREHLLGQQSFSFVAPRPVEMGREVLYPSRFDARYDAETDAYEISVSDFQMIR